MMPESKCRTTEAANAYDDGSKGLKAKLSSNTGRKKEVMAKL
jgi:hypothetical protein